MKIAIFGMGAIGSHLAARLGAGAGAAGLEIAAVARGAQLAAIARNGITLLVGDERIPARIRASDDPASLGPQDVVVVTVKGHSVPEVAPLLRPLLGPGTSVIFAMNGIPWWYLYRLNRLTPRPDLSRLDPDGAVAREVGLERVIGCVIASANEVIEPGIVKNAPGTRNRFTLGEPDGTLSTRIEAIAAAFTTAGAAAPVSQEIRTEIWDKLVRNLSTAPICALTGEPIAVVGRHDELFAIAKSVMSEGIEVAAAHGIALDIDPETLYATRPSSPHKPSMLQDFERGRVPEIDGLLTAVQAFARSAGVATPCLDTIVALVIGKARKRGLYPA